MEASNAGRFDEHAVVRIAQSSAPLTLTGKTCPRFIFGSNIRSRYFAFAIWPEDLQQILTKIQPHLLLYVLLKHIGMHTGYGMEIRLGSDACPTDIDLPQMKEALDFRKIDEDATVIRFGIILRHRVI